MRLSTAFLGLIAAQLAHSIEEYLARLWESFPPATYLSSLVSDNLEQGFILINGTIVMFGLFCYAWPIRQQWKVAVPLAWFWVGLETINGLGHLIWSILEKSYTPGLATALLLLLMATLVSQSLSKQPADQAN